MSFLVSYLKLPSKTPLVGSCRLPSPGGRSGQLSLVDQSRPLPRSLYRTRFALPPSADSSSNPGGVVLLVVVHAARLFFLENRATGCLLCRGGGVHISAHEKVLTSSADTPTMVAAISMAIAFGPRLLGSISILRCGNETKKQKKCCEVH